MAAEEKKLKSLGKKCAAYGCSSREYRVENGTRIKTGDTFFSFPRSNYEVNHWCNLIKRQNGKDGFSATRGTVVCEKHFKKEDLKRVPGRSRYKRINNTELVIHSWTEKKSPRKSLKKRKILIQVLEQKFTEVESESEALLQDPQSLVTEGKSEVSSCECQTMRSQVQELREKLQASEDMCQKLKKEQTCLKYQLDKKIRKDFVNHLVSSDKMCKHYTDFPFVFRCKAVFHYLDPGEEGENIIFGANCKERGDDRSRPRMLSSFNGYLLTLC